MMWSLPGYQVIMQHSCPQKYFLRSTYPSLPGSFKMPHSVHRCLRWHPWNSVIIETGWSRNFSCISLPHIPRHPVEMEHYRTGTNGIYYALTKWNYYLQGSDIIAHNDHNPIQKFLNSKMQTRKWTDGHWISTPITSPVYGYQVSATRQLTASNDW